MSTSTKPITPDDIEAKFRELGGEIEETTRSARERAVIAVAVVAVGVVVAAFVLGRRRGRGRTTIVEIRRV